MLIKSVQESDYSRAGRTDKGVSALGNVISLKVRSENNDNANEMNYIKILNGILPDDIRILQKAEVHDDFNARYHCFSRHYKYFFMKNNLNIELMQEAAL
mgnify:CR=1 FL=1